MPYGRGRRWRRREDWCVEQVANGPDDGIDLTPVSDAPAVMVQAAWAPLLFGQEVPRIGERVYDDTCNCEGAQ